MKSLTPQQNIEIDYCYQVTIKKCQMYKVNPKKVCFGSTASQFIEAGINPSTTWKICIFGHPPHRDFENIGLQAPQNNHHKQIKETS